MILKGYTKHLLAVSYIVLCGVVPMLSLFFEFGRDDGWYLTSLYGHLFLYPIIFGGLAFFFFLDVLKSLLSIEATRQLRLVFAVFLSGITLAALFLIEFTEKKAVFEVTKDQLHSSLKSDDGKSAKSFLEYVKEPDKRYISSFPTVLEGGTFKNFPRLTLPQIAYVASVSCQYLFFITVFFTFTWSLRLFLSKNRQFLEYQERIVKSLFRVYLFVVLWVPWRLAFETYRGELYLAANQNPIKVLAFAFIAGGIYLAIIAWNRYNQWLTSVIGLIASLGVGTLVFNKQWLLHAFPKAPSWQYITMLLLLTLLAVVPFFFQTEADQ